jgi:magnesium transporter
MQQYHLTESGCTVIASPTASSVPQWLACTQLEATQTEGFVAQVLGVTGLAIQPLHAQDAANVLHPSRYDGMPSYDMVVFRSLLPMVATKPSARTKHRLQTIATQPVTFLISDTALITVQHSDKIPLLPSLERIKGAVTPHQLMLRFINAQVDAYLALRQPLTEQLDRWQRELLDPRRAFNDWTALLDARLELRKLEALSEEQIDALNELREAWLEPQALPYDAAEIANLRVRLRDIGEHIERVLNHAKRLETSVESAIQLHFAAVAHQTNRTVRNLTILTVVFAPLTLLTGFYGMNVPLPWQGDSRTYEWILLAMALLAGIVLGSLLTTRLFGRRFSQNA